MFQQQPSPSSLRSPTLPTPLTLPLPPATDAVAATSSHAQPDSAPTNPRGSHLRRLSYLKNYTQSHLQLLTISRDNSASSSSSTTSSAASRPVGRLLRSVSYSPSSAAVDTTPPLAASLAFTTPPASAVAPSAPASASGRFSFGPATVSLLLSSETPTPRTAPVFASAFASATAPSSTAPLLPTSEPSTPTAPTDHYGPCPPLASALIPPPFKPPIEPSTTTAPDGRSHAAVMTRTRAATASDVVLANGGHTPEAMPSIRFSSFYDPRATRPSLKFTPISRTLPTGKEVIRVGRYSERDVPPNVPINVPSSAPVGFKSKVVSRRHCEFWHEDGKWYIKDVKSSSGTFLNHIRLSPPGTESKPFPINDGDIVQLGIDFKGGEEMIFRCVKMRLELNRGWQNKLNAFNMSTHKRLRDLTKSGDANSSGQTSQDCSICLNSIAPCQCLFVAPCSHTWHFKCIRSLLTSPQYPIFICPNCRAAADLEADVEDPEEWEQLDSDLDPADTTTAPDAAEPPRIEAASSSANPPAVALAAPDVVRSPPSPQNRMQAFGAGQFQELSTDGDDSELSSHATSNPVAIPRASSAQPPAMSGAQGVVADMHNMDAPASSVPGRVARTPSPTQVGVTTEGPITPRNDAGPWVFDGGVIGRLGAGPLVAAPVTATAANTQMTSLDDIARA